MWDQVDLQETGIKINIVCSMLSIHYPLVNVTAWAFKVHWVTNAAA